MTTTGNARSWCSRRRRIIKRTDFRIDGVAAARAGSGRSARRRRVVHASCRPTGGGTRAPDSAPACPSQAPRWRALRSAKRGRQPHRKRGSAERRACRETAIFDEAARCRWWRQQSLDDLGAKAPAGAGPGAAEWKPPPPQAAGMLLAYCRHHVSEPSSKNAVHCVGRPTNLAVGGLCARQRRGTRSTTRV